MGKTMPMVVADPLAAFEREGMIKLLAPAKVNLFLGVGDLQSDGFHEVITIMHTLSLHDVLQCDYFPESEGGLCVELTCLAREGLPPLEIEASDNLVYRAIHLLAKKLHRTTDETIKVRIEKHIPSQGGLGGGSSDAAAALIAAAHFWGIETDNPAIFEVARMLGSDVVFFLYGGCACFKGRGDILTHHLEPMKGTLLLVKPEGGVSTKEAYRSFDKEQASFEKSVRLLELAQEEACRAKQADEVPLYNNLTQAAESILPELKKVQEWCNGQPEIKKTLLCGSGSTLFALGETFEEACRLSAQAQLQGWWARTTSFSPLGVTLASKR